MSPYSFQSTVELLNKNFALILLAGIFFIIGFFVGSLWTENEIIKAGGTGTGQAAGTQPAANAGAAAAPTGPTEAQLKQVPKVEGSDHARGAGKAKITLIEYSDFECPFCKNFHATTKQVLANFGNDVQIVYRHYPLSFHPQAQKLAETSECVAEVGGKDAFWKFHDFVFESDATVSDSTAMDAVAALGYNTSAVQSCLDNGKYKQKVTDQMSGGAKAGIQGTPGTILVSDGKYELISGAQPYAQVEATIKKYLD